MVITYEIAIEFLIQQSGLNHLDNTTEEIKYGLRKEMNPNIDIANLTLSDAFLIYKRDYWDKCECNLFPTPLNLYILDCAVDQGNITAIKLFQKVLGINQDGKIDQITRSGINTVNKFNIMEYLSIRAIKYSETDGYEKFGRIWNNRLFLLSSNYPSGCGSDAFIYQKL